MLNHLHLVESNLNSNGTKTTTLLRYRICARKMCRVSTEEDPTEKEDFKVEIGKLKNCKEALLGI